MNNKNFLFVLTGIALIINALFSSMGQFIIGSLLIIAAFWLSYRKARKSEKNSLILLQ